MNKKTFWHALDYKEVVKRLNSNSEFGLTEKEVKIRRAKFGENKLPEEKPLPGVKLFLEQFKSPLIYILVIAGIVTIFLKEFTDSLVIFGAVFVDTIVGFLQENKASKTLQKLKEIVQYEATVLRDENSQIVYSKDLVPGDIIILSPGDKVPADGRILESYNLKIDEMALTGEWLAAKKNSDILPEATPLADRDNMVYMGTIVEDGKGKAVVTEIGIETEIGKVAQLVKETKEEKTPYQQKLANFSGIVGFIIAFICVLIFILGLASGKGFKEMFTTSVAVAVAAIPEGLPVAMTIILALGMQRILRKGGLVRKLASAETLGSTSVICTDKTATLTEGKMKVSEIIGDKFLSLKAATLTSEAFIENPTAQKGEWILRGRPTDRALLEAGIDAGINWKEFEKKKIAELPFNPINKFVAALYDENGEKILYICGAAEVILELSKSDTNNKERLEKQFEELARKGMRVVATAYRKIERSEPINNLKTLCKDLIFIGFITLKDPIRKEVKMAIDICKKAGMRPIIVTGDHELTAMAVAAELGFDIKKEAVLEGKDLDELSDDELGKKLEKIQIFSRVEPKHKMRIVEAWQEKGEVVAMTGDGVNDAPALKKADIGVALGSGTEVAKETSDLILLNDSFSIIVAAVEEGRAILDNIRKVITYLLTDSFTEVILIGGSLVVSWLTRKPWILPVTAVQILWVNFIEDGLPDIALAFEPKEKDLMQRKPGDNKKALLSNEMKSLILIIGLITDLFVLVLFYWLLRFSHYEIQHIRTIMFAALAIDSLFYVFSCKSLRKNVWHINLFSNKFLVLSWIIGVAMLMFSIYFPSLQAILRTTPLNFFDWSLLLSLGFLNLFLIEMAKWYFIAKKEL